MWCLFCKHAEYEANRVIKASFYLLLNEGLGGQQVCGRLSAPASNTERMLLDILRVKLMLLWRPQQIRTGGARNICLGNVQTLSSACPKEVLEVQTARPQRRSFPSIRSLHLPTDP